MEELKTRAAVLLGEALEVRFVDDEGEKILRFKAGTLAIWNEAKRALVIPTEAKKARAASLATLSGPLAGAAKRAARTFEKWTGYRRDASKVSAVKVTGVAKRRDVGRCLAVAYRSDKFHAKGSPIDYEHETGPRVRVHEAGSVFVIKGGRLRLTARGLEG